MSKFSLLLFCASALLIQGVFSACLETVGVVPSQVNTPTINLGNIKLGGCGGSLNNIALNSGVINSAALNGAYLSNNAGLIGSNGAGYGGHAIGEISAIGELPVSGVTNVDGSLPVYGIITFNGNLPAGGVVTVLGNTPTICECSC